MKNANPLPQAATLGSAAEILERADREATEDPAEAVSVALEAVRVARAAGIVCLEARALAILGFALGLSGRRRLAAAAFDAATAYGCSCCLPAIERRRAFLVHAEEGALRAVEVAREALNRAKRTAPGEVALCRQTYGVMLYYAGDVSESSRELAAVIDSLPVETPYYCAVLQNLCTALAASEGVDDIRYAVGKLQAIPDRLKGKKRLTQQRAKLAWSTGQALGRLAMLDSELSAVKRRAMLKEAARQLRIALDGLRILRLPLEIAACHSDLAAVLIRVDPLLVEETLDFETQGLSAEITDARESAQKAARAIISLDSITALGTALRSLRDATVAAGAPAPVIAYAQPW
jgi:tetratricopeptide (TPR) repeat protein